MFDNAADVRARAQYQSNMFGNLLSILNDVTLPIISYFSGVGLNNLLRTMYKPSEKRFAKQEEMQIEDLWIKYCCITTSMVKQQMSVHETGPLWKYVKASMALLGTFPPVYDNGDVLIDGGYVNNLPIDVIFAMGADTIVAVDVENKDNSQWELLTNWGDSLSGWWLFARLIMSKLGIGGKVNLPKMSDAQGTLFYIASTMRLIDMIEEGERSGKLLYLHPSGIEQYGIAEYGRIDEIVKKGYSIAKAKLPEFREYRLKLLETSSPKKGVLSNKLSFGELTSLSATAPHNNEMSLRPVEPSFRQRNYSDVNVRYDQGGASTSLAPPAEDFSPSIAVEKHISYRSPRVKSETQLGNLGEQ